MKTLRIKVGRTYRDATRDEVLDVAASYAIQDMAGETLASPEHTESFLRRVLTGRHHEQFVVVFLNNRHKVLATDVMFQGTIDGTSVYPREVVKRALEYNAAALILAHNHPSGIAEPSQADERITRRLKSALELIDVRVLDHIVMTEQKATSLASRGLI